MSTATPVVQLAESGQAFTTSRNVAAYFGKRHDHVLRDIEKLVAELDAIGPTGCPPNFGETSTGAIFTLIDEEVAQPNGGTRREPAYAINRDGFTLLAMGFTGSKALAFKVAYIKAFNTMEARLRSLYLPAEEADQDLHRRVSPRLWPVLLQRSHALLVRVKTETDPDLRRNAYWALYRVNTSLGIPVPSMAVLGLQPLALPGAEA